LSAPRLHRQLRRAWCRREAARHPPRPAQSGDHPATAQVTLAKLLPSPVHLSIYWLCIRHWQARGRSPGCREKIRRAPDRFLLLSPNPVSFHDTGIGRKQQESIGRSDRKSTRLNSSHSQISYAVFCLKKKKIFTGNAS